MPKHKQYSHKYRRTISQHAVREIRNNLQAHKSEMVYLVENYDNHFLEVNNDQTDSISETAPDEIIQEIVQEKIIPEIIQEAIVEDQIISPDEYDSDSLSESDNEHNSINIDRLQKNLVKWSHDNKICRSAVTSLLKVLKIEKAMQSFP
ncbi:uncharacterized protein LOC120358918 [Solenopsis invicta]|uniref:uncharacterized protein LOC120358918 n=1 Tax=Solenopsis invicta TaxID=13686 RepID=UPI00193D2CD9|nr:uncharacterized protein LOC120358918 [Solenopsis invicta]